MTVERGDGWELRLGDCLDPESGLASLESCDHVITDPPYAKSVYQRFRTNKGSGLRANGNRVSDDKALRVCNDMAAERIGSIDDILDDCAVQFARVARRWVAVWSDYDSATTWKCALVDAGMEWRRTDAWAKSDYMPQITGDRPAQGTEVYTLAHAGKKSRWNGGGKTGAHVGGICKGDARPDHPCPKPLWLMEAQVRDFTDPGELICDPFAGSGTTGVACIRLGRRFIGWERDPKYFAIAVKRLRAAREQLTMFAKDATP